MVRAVVVLVALVALCAACTEPRSKRCQDVCAREAECHDSIETTDNFDEGECLDACATLERDVKATEQVEHHAACVAEAEVCEQVVACP